jgi:hypothetical protein
MNVTLYRINRQLGLLSARAARIKPVQRLAHPSYRSPLHSPPPYPREDGRAEAVSFLRHPVAAQLNYGGTSV